MTNKQNKLYEELKKRKSVQVNVRFNSSLFVDMLEICSKKRIEVSSYIRQLVANDIKHTTYETSNDDLLSEIVKKWRY